MPASHHLLFSTQTQMLHLILLSFKNYTDGKSKAIFKKFLHKAVAPGLSYSEFDKAMAESFTRLNKTPSSQLHVLQFCIESQYNREDLRSLKLMRKQFNRLSNGLREDEGLDHIHMDQLQIIELVKKLLPDVNAVDYIKDVILPQKHVRTGSSSYSASRVLQILFLTNLYPEIRTKLGWQWSIVIPQRILQGKDQSRPMTCRNHYPLIEQDTEQQYTKRKKQFFLSPHHYISQASNTRKINSSIEMDQQNSNIKDYIQSIMKSPKSPYHSKEEQLQESKLSYTEKVTKKYFDQFLN